MIARVKCTYADTYLIQNGIPTKDARYRGKNELIGTLSGESFVYNKKQYLGIQTDSGTFYVKKVAVNLVKEDNTNYGDGTRENNSSITKGGFLLGLAALLFLED